MLMFDILKNADAPIYLKSSNNGADNGTCTGTWDARAGVQNHTYAHAAAYTLIKYYIIPTVW